MEPHLKIIEESWLEVLEYFQNDAAKTLLWFSLSNPSLGDFSPCHMIRMGREEKLLKFIKGLKSEN